MEIEPPSTGKQMGIPWQTSASGFQQLGYLEEGAVQRVFLPLELSTLIYPSFHREQQAVFSNSCAFQTKTLFRKMSRMWAVCFSRIWWDFPTQTALCVPLKDEALTSHVAKAWWMTWSSQFTFGWRSQVNRQKCLGIWWTAPSLSRLVFDGVGGSWGFCSIQPKLDCHKGWLQSSSQGSGI